MERHQRQGFRAHVQSGREHVRSFNGVMRESAWILSHHGGLLSLLASTLVLPLCFMLLSHTLVSVPLIQRIRQDKEFVQAHSGTDAARDRQTDLSSEWVYLLIFFAVYLLCVLAFSLLSTAAVVYSVACMYLENSISYRKVISVVPTVWKRLIVTFLWVFILIFAYHAIAILFFHLIYENFPEISFVAFVLVVVLVWFAFFCIHVYISCIWHLSSVITVLEDSYGLRALLKSVELIKGNRRVAIQLFIVYLGLVTLISFVFHGYVLGLLIEDGAGSSLSLRLLLGTALVALFTFVTLYGMLAQTVFYFACKAFHNEQIDWVALSDHLAAYMGEYVQLKSAIQMESV